MNSSTEDGPASQHPETESAEPESKSQRKRNAQRITELASQLVQMKPKVLAALPLEPEIHEAVSHCAEIKSHGARKRQLHFVSKLLRETENIEQLQARVLHPELNKKKQAITNPHLEFRDRLIEDFAGTADDLRESYPTIELQRVRQLVRNAHAEHKKVQDANQKTGTDKTREDTGSENTGSEDANTQPGIQPEIQPRIHPGNNSQTANNTKSAKSLLKLLTKGS